MNYVKNQNSKGSHWSNEEDQILTKNFLTKSNKELENFLPGRSEVSIQSKISKSGMKRDLNTVQVDDNLIDKSKSYFDSDDDNDYTLSDIATPTTNYDVETNIIAEYLMLKNGQTTTKEVKKELRQMEYYVTQEQVSSSMQKLGNNFKTVWDFINTTTDGNTHREYSMDW